MTRLACRRLLLPAIIAFGQSALAQDAPSTEPSPVSFTGTTRLLGQSSTRSGSDQALPPSFLRWEFQSLLTAYGLPISMNALVTSEQNSTPQHLNYFSIGLSQADLQQLVRQRISERVQKMESIIEKAKESGIDAVKDSLRVYEPASLKDATELDKLDELRQLQSMKPSDLQHRASELKDLGITSAISGIASLFPTLAFGTMFPQYSPLTLNGAAVTGADVEFTPGPMYFAFTGGKMLDAGQGLSSVVSLASNPTFGRTLTAGRLGVGARDDSHLYLTALYAKDDGSSLQHDSTAVPQSNYVFGSEGKLLLLSDKLNLNGEVAVSILANHNGGVGSSAPVPHWVEKIAGSGNGGTYDYAFTLGATYDVSATDTRLSATMLRVGPGYASFGVPFLRTDNLRVETKAEQRFLDRQVSAAAFYRRDEDNLRETKDNSTVMNAFGAQVGVAVKDYPYLRLSYAPLSQQNKRVSDSLNVKNDVTAMTAVTGYTFRTKGGMVSSTTASLNYQEGKTQSGLGAYITRNALVSEALIIGAPLMFMLTGGWNATEVDTTTTRLVTIDASATYTAFGVWQNTIALSTVRDAVKRTSISFTSGAPIGTIAMFSLSVEHTTFDDPSASANNYTETVVRAILSKSW